MKYKFSLAIFILALLNGFQGIAQSSIITASDKVEVSTTRQSDIEQFRNEMSQFSAVAESGAKEEINVRLNSIVKIAAVEIARTKMNLQELNDGDIDDLEKWQQERYPDKPVNVKLEIQVLTSRLKSEEYLYNRMKTWDVSTLSDSRQAQSLRGAMNSFLRNMENNLKYGDGTIVRSKPTTTSGSGSTNGGFIVKKEQGATSGAMDPNVKNYLESKQMREDEYRQNYGTLKKTINDADDKPAKKAFRALVEIMNNELNANNWMLSMINAGAIKNSGIDPNTLSSRIKQQQSILEQANKLRPELTTSFGENKTEVLNIASGFVTTF